MAGKGGAWKVAYADFVTAMMAFFMVMWLITQDQKVKESIARYFQSPAGLKIFGSSTKPEQNGGLLEADQAGPIPGSRLRSAGRGLGDAQDPEDQDNESQIVNEWLFDDTGWADLWRPVAEEQVRRAQQMHFEGTQEERQEQEEAFARRQLADRLKELVLTESATLPDGVCKDLLYRATSRVDWHRVADECLWELNDVPQ